MTEEQKIFLKLEILKILSPVTFGTDDLIADTNKILVFLLDEVDEG